MNGFYNMAININLSQKSFELKHLPDSLLKRVLGGRGLASHLLLEYNPPKTDPLGADNHLIFTTGPFAGTKCWGSSRYGVYTKSPQTGFISESYSGGDVAEHIAATGFDALIISGAANEPVWLELCENTVRFHSAFDLQGLDTYATEDRVKDWIAQHRPQAKKCGVVCIGPAGEKQVSFAVIENNYWRSAGRTGTGAVMGSKNIKAIAFWGNREKALADSTLINDFSRSLTRSAKKNPGVEAYRRNGTPMLVDIMDKVGGFPTRYWQKGRSDNRENINTTALHERCKVIPHSCRRCFIACGRMATVKSGRFKNLKIEGPEYETIYAFGGLCEVGSIEEIVYLNDICDRLGMDTITSGNLAALAIEAVKQGRIDYNIDYGETDAIACLLEDIACRNGIGDLLARGIKVAAREWEMEDQAIHVKGLEPAGYDPRVLKGMGLAYGTSARGACHLRATFYKPELSGIIDPDKIAGKAAVFTEWEDRLTIFDTLILCRFFRDLYQWEELTTMIRGVTGLELDRQALRQMAARVTDNTRRFNIREGLNINDDRLPKRFHTEALPETGKIITREEMELLLKEYYKERGWDEMGIPPGDRFDPGEIRSV